MILRIMDGCIRFLDETNNAGLDENWRIIFEHSIAREVSRLALIIYEKPTYFHW